MKRFSKVLFIISLVFLVRVLQSCCTCSEDPVLFDFSSVIIKNLNNAGSTVTYNETNYMYSAAVAFEVLLTGDMGNGELRKEKRAPLSFQEAGAFECDCSLPFASNQTITEISITTLKKMSPQIDSGDVVTDLFVADVEDGFLFTPMTEVCEKVNQEVYYDEPTARLQIFCTENILNDTARFSVRVAFSDNNEIITKTEYILLTPSR